MTPDLTVVVPTYARVASVGRLLDALTKQTLASDRFEVVVAIDGSADGTTELVAGYRAPYRLSGVWQQNSGRAAACNAGIRGATAPIVVILDDDMEPAPACLEAHHAAHQAGDSVCVMGAVPIALEPGASPLASYFKAKFDDHLRRLAEPGHRFVVRDFFSGNASVERALLEEAGLYDEDFRIYGNEDLDLAIRLRAAGATFVYEPRALARQRFQKDFRGAAEDAEAKGRTAVLLLRKHPEALPELRLATYRQAPAAWLHVRRALVGAGRRTRLAPRLLGELSVLLERAGAPRLRLYYDLALDYFFWLGVEAGIDELRATDGCASSTRLLLHG